MNKVLFSLLLVLSSFGSNAQTIFQDNFDTGIGAWTITDLLNDGNTWLGTVGGSGGNFLDGTEFALVDSDAYGNGIQMIEDLTSPVFNTSGYTTLYLEFDQYYRAISTADSGLVQVFNGTQWVTVATMVGTSLGAWNAPNFQSIDISAHANANMQVRFHYNDGNTWAWWWAIDNVHIYSPLVDDPGAIAINNNSGLNLTTTEAIDIDIENFGGNILSNIPVYYRINGGAPVGPEVVAGPVNPGTTANHVFAATADLSVPGSYLIEAWTALSGDTDPSNDTIAKTIVSAINPPLNLPFCADFEDAQNVVIENGQITPIVAGLPYLTFESGNVASTFGRLRTQAGPGFAQSGIGALTIDDNPSGSVVANFVNLEFDMTNYDATSDVILLDYSFMEHGDEVHVNDKVWVRGSNVDPWIVIGDWNTISGGTNGVYFTQSDIDISAVLNANTQNFSSTFAIRIGQEDNFPATSTTASDGVTFDDICIRQLLANDAQVDAITSPSNNACGSDMTDVCAVISNQGVDTIFTMPIEMNWSDGTNSGTLTTTYNDTLAFGETATVCFSSINTMAGGPFTFEVITLLPGDTIMNSNDTLATTVNIIDMSIGMDSVYCINAGDSIALFSNNLAAGNYLWYDSLVGGNLIFIGDTLMTGPVFADTSYFVERSSTSQFTIGAPSNAVGTGGQYSFYLDGLRFNVFEPIVIDSLTVYPEGSGDLVVNVRDDLGALVGTTTIAVVQSGAPFDPVRVGINIPVGIGNAFTIDANGTTITNLFRNDFGGAFPYVQPGVMEIYETINQLAGFYYFYYDWLVSVQGCGTERYEVQVNIAPSVSMSTLSDACLNANPVVLTVGSPSGGVYSGTGVAAGEFDPMVAGVGTHVITYEYAGVNGCSNADSTSIIVNDIPTVTLAAMDTTCVYFDPITLSGGSPVGGTYSGTGVTGGQFDPATAGEGTHTITYEYTDGNGCTATSTTDIVVDGCATVSSLDGVETKIFPNPSNGLVNIVTEGEFSFTITDMNGAVVSSGNASNNTTVNTATFTAGMYFVNVSNIVGTTTAKLIVQ